MTIEICQNADLIIGDKGKYIFHKEMESNSAESSAEGKQGMFECPKCQKKFGQPEVLQLHLLLHESSEVAEEAGALDNAEPPKGTENDKCFDFGDRESGSKTVKTEFLPSSSKRSVGLTKVKLEDCLRCDECSCIYIHENDYKKHMKNFHKGDTAKKSKQRKGCRSCCKQCNCRQSYKTVQKERGNNNLFHYNIKDRWSKMLSRRLKLEPPSDSVNGFEAMKVEPDTNPDYSELLSRVEVSIKTEPPEELPAVSVQMEQSCPQIDCGPRGA